MENKNKSGQANKGLTLLEVLVAVCLFAIVVTPITASLLTCFKINLRSRTILTATDVAQTLMEGFSDKTFEDCKSTVTGLGGSLVSGFSSINNNHYNTGSNADGASIPWSAVSALISVDKYETRIPSTAAAKANKLYVADSGAINAIYATALKSHCENKKLYYTINSDGNFMFLGYTGIEAKGLKFDAVVSFLPVPNDSSDTWYTYEVFIDVYQYKDTAAANRLNQPTVSIKSGILSKARL